MLFMKGASAIGGVAIGFVVAPSAMMNATQVPIMSALTRKDDQSDAPAFFHHQAWACEPKNAPKQMAEQQQK